MLSMLTGLAKTAVRTVVATPVAAALDVLTLGGACVGRDETYTGEQFRKIAEQFEDALDE